MYIYFLYSYRLCFYFRGGPMKWMPTIMSRSMLAENAKFNASWCRFADRKTQRFTLFFLVVSSCAFGYGRIDSRLSQSGFRFRAHPLPTDNFYKIVCLVLWYSIMFCSFCLCSEDNLLLVPMHHGYGIRISRKGSSELPSLTCHFWGRCHFIQSKCNESKLYTWKIQFSAQGCALAAVPGEWRDA